MKRRIFIAVNLSEGIKKRLQEFRDKCDYLPVRWTKEASLHLTLVFIGYVSNEQMLEACRVVREAVSETEPFFINFKRIVLAPSGKPPRMIWLEGETSQNLNELKNKLEDALLESDSGLRRKESRPMSPHITLARIKTEQWRNLPSLPKIEERFEAQLSVASVEVMESDLKHDGAEYSILESCPLGDN